MEVENNGFKTYSFRIKKNKSNDKNFKNLVVVSKDGIFDFYVYQYLYNESLDIKFPYSIKKQKIDKNTLDISSIKQYLSKEQSCGTTVEIEASGEEYTCRCCGRKYIHPTCTSGYETEVLFETVVTYLGPCGGEATGGDPFDNLNEDESTNYDPNYIDCNPHGSENNDDPAVGVVNPADEFDAFAEDKLTPEQLTYINYFGNRTFKGQLEFFMFDNNYSLDAENFSKEAIDAKMENNNVDINFEDQIINNLSGKEKCAFEKLKQLDLFKTTIEKFGNGSNYNLTLKSRTNGACNSSYDDGCTDASDLANGNITIYIQNPGRGTLDVAVIILHEGIHAEIFKYVDEYKKGQDPNNRKKLLEWYFTYKAQNDNTLLTSNAQHQHMADKYVKPIAQALRQLDNNQYSLNDYMGFAWEGLRSYGYDGYRDNDKWVTLDKNQYIGNINKVLDNTNFNKNCN